MLQDTNASQHHLAEPLFSLITLCVLWHFSGAWFQAGGNKNRLFIDDFVVWKELSSLGAWYIIKKIEAPSDAGVLNTMHTFSSLRPMSPSYLDKRQVRLTLCLFNNVSAIFEIEGYLMCLVNVTYIQANSNSGLNSDTGQADTQWMCFPWMGLFLSGVFSKDRQKKPEDTRLLWSEQNSGTDVYNMAERWLC